MSAGLGADSHCYKWISINLDWKDPSNLMNVAV